MTPYTIAIGGRNEASAGIRALHVLRDELRARGYQANMEYEGVIPDSIAVYPEIQGGNPLGATRVARWLLGAAPDIPHDGPQFQWGGGMDPNNSPILCVDLLEPDLFHPNHGLERKGTGYWIGRGGSNWDMYGGWETVSDWDELPSSRGRFATRADYAHWLAGLDLFISFDPYTAVITEAITVGTPVLVLADRKDPRRSIGIGNQWNLYGVAWSIELTKYARDTVHLAHDHYREVCVPEFTKQIDHFVTLTQEL